MEDMESEQSRQHSSNSEDLKPLTQNQKSRLYPIPLPVVAPPDSHSQVRRLENVLNDQASPVIVEPAILQTLDKRYAEEHGEYHN